MIKKVDINCDMGESYYKNKIGNDSKIMPFITSCNIACGFHWINAFCPKKLRYTSSY